MIPVAPKAPKRDDDRGVPFPRTAAPVEPYWAELARQTFARRWHDENGDDYERRAS